MGIRASSILLSDNAKAALADLRSKTKSDKPARSILRRCESLKLVLGGDILHGEVVRKPLPKALVDRYGAQNLFVEDLPNFWRLIYTNVRRGTERYVIILEIVDHATYDKWFPGKGR